MQTRLFFVVVLLILWKKNSANFSNKGWARTQLVGRVVECVPDMHEAVGLMPKTIYKNRRDGALLETHIRRWR